MGIYSNKTPIELNKIANDFKKEHEQLKNEIIEYTKVIDDTQKKINILIKKLTELENDYVLLVEEIDKR